jgi:hypothetical protein
VLERTVRCAAVPGANAQDRDDHGRFSGAEAEELRRALSFHRSVERMEKVSVKLRAGMEKNGVAPEVIVKIIEAISSFALYGFPSRTPSALPFSPTAAPI